MTNKGARKLRKQVSRYGSQRVVAAAIGCKQSTVCRWVNGSRKPDSRWRLVLRERLGIQWWDWEAR